MRSNFKNFLQDSMCVCISFSLSHCVWVSIMRICYKSDLTLPLEKAPKYIYGKEGYLIYEVKFEGWAWGSVSKSDKELLTTGGSCQLPIPRFSSLNTQMILMQMREVWALRYTGLKIFAFSCLFTLVKRRRLRGKGRWRSVDSKDR